MNFLQRFSLIFLTFTSVESLKGLLKSQDNQILSTALVDVVNNLFITQEIQFDLIIYEKVSFDIDGVINGFRKGGLHFTIIKVSNKRNRFVERSAIIFCESLVEVQKFLVNQKFARSFSPLKYRFLFYTNKPFNVSKMRVKNLHSFSGEISWFSYFLIKEKSKKKIEILLKLSMVFSSR